MVKGTVILVFALTSVSCCPALRTSGGFIRLEPCSGVVQVSTATGMAMVSCRNLETFMFYGVALVEKDGCSWKALGHTPCRDSNTIHVRKALGCETFLDDFLIGLASGGAVLLIVLVISSAQRLREIRRIRQAGLTTRFSWCKTGLKYHCIPVDFSDTSLNVKSGFISWKVVLISVLALMPCPVPACVKLRELSMVSNFTNYIADLWPGQHVCIGGDVVMARKQGYGHVLKTMYYTASWSFSESEPEAWCVAAGCQDKSCGTTFGEVIHVEDSVMITNFCEQSSWNQGICWKGGGCLYYTTRIKINTRRPWAVRTGMEGTPMGLDIEGKLSSCEIRRLGGMQPRTWNPELTLLTEDVDKRSFLCPTTSSRGFAREAMLGDLQSSDRDFEKPLLARNSFKCNLDHWKGSLKCFYKDSFIDSMTQECKELPAEIDGVTYHMTNERTVMATVAEPIQILVSCESSTQVSQENRECTIISSDLYGADGSGFGLYAVVTTTISVGSSITIQSDCLASPWVVSCDESTHFSPPISNSKCQFDNVSSVSHIIDVDHLSSVKMLETTKSWTGSWVGLKNIKWPPFLSGFGSPLIMLIAAVLVLRR